MDEQRISELINKYFADTATEQEREELLHWYRSENHQEIIWPEDEEAFEQRIAHVFSKISQSIDIDEKSPVALRRRRTPWKLISVAAVLVMAMGIVLTLFLSKQDAPEDLVEAIKPAGHKAILTLANGKSITLGDSNSTTIDYLASVGAFTAENGELLLYSDEQSLEAISTNTLTTPKGGQYTIRLSDGSKAALNVESSLTFPNSFVGSERRVTLEGEAYFEVAKNTEKPFIIEMPSMEIEVLGTAFNVRNYPDEVNISTSLVEGSVKVKADKKEWILQPGEAAILNKTNGSLHTVKADLDAETAWNKGYFIFKDQHIESIMKQLSRWYDVEVDYRGDMQNMEFSGRILRRSDIVDVLNMLEQTETIKFEIEGRRVIVMP